MFLGTFKKLSGLAFLACSLFSVSVLADDIDVSIDTYPSQFTPGQTSAAGAYVVTVSKDGSGTVAGIVVRLSFSGSSGVNEFDWSCSGAGASSCSAGSGTNNDHNRDFTLSLDGTNAVTLTVGSVAYEAEFFNNLTLSVDVTNDGASNNDNNSANDTDSQGITRSSITDISLTNNDGKANYKPGENSTYTIKVSNTGPSAAQNLNVSDVIMAGFNITSWGCVADSGSSCSNAGGSNSNLNPVLQLDVNDEATITVNADYASSATADPMDYEVQVALGDSQSSDPNNTSPLSNTDSNNRILESQLAVAVATNPVSSNYIPGDTQEYTVTVTNNGPSDVNNVTVVDNSPSPINAVTWNCAVSAGSQCDLTTDNDFIDTTVDLVSGGVATFTVMATYDSGATLNPLVYEVTATNPAGHTPTSPVQGNVSLQPDPFSEFTVSLDDGTNQYTPGTSQTYTYTLTNDGPSDVSDVSVTDNDLSEFGVISWSCDIDNGGSSSCDDSSGTTAIDTEVDIVAGESITFTIDVDYVSSAVTNPLVYSLTATNPNNSGTPQSVASDSDALMRQVDLSITKTGKNGSLVPNEPFTYVITVANAGPSDLGAGTIAGGEPEPGVLLTDVFDQLLLDHPTKCPDLNNVPDTDDQPCWEWCVSDGGVPNSSISPDNCPEETNVVTGAGQQLSQNIRLSAGSQSQVYIHTRVGFSDNGYTECDSNIPGSNEICNSAQIELQDNNTTATSGTIKTDETSNEIIIGTDIVVSKTDHLTSATPGSQITYEIEVSNDGFIAAEAVSVDDVLDLFSQQNSAGFESGSISWFCEANTPGACCTSGTSACGLNGPTNTVFNDELHASIDLASQASVTFTVNATIDSEASGTIQNTASATLSGGVTDSDPLNNSDQDTTDLAGESDASVSKEIVNPTVNTSDPDVVDLTYEIRVTNLGPSRDTSINVVDSLNSSKLDLSTASWTCAVTGTGSCSQPGPVTGQGINSHVDLAVGAEALFVISVSTQSGSNGQVYNSVNVISSGIDNNSLNNQADAEYSLSGNAEIIIENDDFRSTAVPGDGISYSMRINNQGPDDLFGASVENVFPPELQDINWTCDAVSPIPGDLTWFQSSDKTLPGSAMTVSSDGRHIYVGSPDTDGSGVIEGSLQVYQRSTLLDSQFGQILNIQSIIQGQSGIDGLQQPLQVLMGPNDRFVYVLSMDNSGANPVGIVSIFSRVNNSAASDFGTLTYQGVITDQMPEVPQMMQISSDGEHFYLSGDDVIQVYDRDTNSGGLTSLGMTAHMGAGVMSMSDDGAALYVADINGADMTAYTRDNDGQLVGVAISSISFTGLTDIYDIAQSADGRHLYLAAAGNKQALVIERNTEDNTISLAYEYDDTDLALLGVETLVGVEAVSVSADGEHVIFSNHVDSAMYVLSRNTQGLLSRDQRITKTGLEGLTDAVFTPDGKHVLTTARGGSPKTLVVFERRQPDPLFSFMESERQGDFVQGDSGPQVDGLLGASALVMSDDGKHVYATGLGSNAVVQFKRDKNSGTVPATAESHLTYEFSYFNNFSNFKDLVDLDSIAITPNDQFIIVGSSDQSTLAVLKRDSQGDLTFVDSYVHQANQPDGLLGISDMVIDQSGQNLYISARYQASVTHYKIASDGLLTLQSSIANGDPGVSGLAGARAVALSPGEEHLYVASGIDDAVVVIALDDVDGSMSFVGRNLTAGDQPRDVVVSDDGGHVYVVSSNDSKISVFQRISNPTNNQFGELILIKTYQDGIGGFDYLSGARRIVISPDDTRLYVAAEFDDAITVLDRDDNPNSSSYGFLTMVEFQIDGLNSEYGFEQPYDLITSYDGRHVYATGFADHAISGFILGSGSSCAAQGSGNIEDRVDIGANGTLTYQINATIRANAEGDLITQGVVNPPENFTFNNNADNCPTSSSDDVCDIDTTELTPMYDLSLSKNDGRISAVPGQSSVYEIIVNNNGPSDAISRDSESIQVLDILSQSFNPNSVSWTCEAIGSGSLQQTQVLLDDNDVNDFGLQGVAAIAYSEDLAGLGPHVITASVLDDSISAFSIDILTGDLTFVASLEADSNNYLQGARDIILIDDDIYVASQVADALVRISANDNGGLSLQFEQAAHFSNGVFGLNQAMALTASNNGAHIYVAAANANAMVVFERDLNTGSLTDEQVIEQGMNNADGLSGINDVAISTDGYSVYTSGLNQSAIGVYQRNLSTGLLTFQVLVDTSLLGVDLSGISAVIVSPDDEHVYATSAGQNKLFIFKRDTADTNSPNYGELSLLSTISQGEQGVSGLLSPANLNISDDGRHVYVAAEQSDALLWFGRDKETGMLSFGGLISDRSGVNDGLNGVIDMAISDDGSTVYAVASQDHAISAYQRRADSECPASGVGNISLNNDTEGVAVSVAAQGQLIFRLTAEVASNASGSVVNEAGVYACPAGHGGSVTDCVGSETDTDNNVGIDSNTVNTSADLSITKTDGLALYDGLLGAVRIAGTNKHLYTAARGDNAIGVFSRVEDQNSPDFGQLNFEQSVLNGQSGVSGLLAVSDVIINAQGDTVYAAGSGDNSVVVMRRNVASGELEFLEKQTSGIFGVEGLEGVSDLAISSDGAHLYATGPLTGTLTVFSVNQDGGVNNGRLSYQQKLQNAVGGVNGLAAVSDVVVSEDGKHVYAISNSDNSVSVFLRNPNANSQGYGELSYQVTYRQGDPGIGGLVGPQEMVMSTLNGGEYIYILGAADSSLVVFSRDTSTGELTFVQYKQNGTDNVVGLSNATHLVLNDDETQLYVAGQLEDTLVRFNRNTSDGTLLFAQSIEQGDSLGQPGEFVQGLDGVSGVFVTSDTQQIFSVASQSHAINAFSIEQSGAMMGTLNYQYSLKDGEGGVAPGSQVIYVIVARNDGPSDAERVVVEDIFPAEFATVEYECYPVNGADCRSGQTYPGNVQEIVDLPAGSQVEIIAVGQLRPDASGMLSNTATVMSSTDAQYAISDPNINNNTATDDNTLLAPAVDLVVTKDNGLTEVIPGTQVTYEIVVRNENTANVSTNPAILPSDARGVLVSDVVPESISQVTWTCSASPEVGLLLPSDGLNDFIVYQDLDNYLDIVMNDNGTKAFVLGEIGSDTVLISYQRDSRDGALTELYRILSSDNGINGLAGANRMVMSHDQKSLYVSSPDDDSLLYFSVDVSGVLNLEQILIDNISGINGLGGVTDLVLSADDRFIYTASPFDHAIGVFNRSLSTGLLSQAGLLSGVEGLTGVNHLSLHENGQILFATAPLNQSLAAFDRNHSSGLLTVAGVIQNFQISSFGLTDPTGITTVGDRILVTDGSDDVLSVFNYSDGNNEFTLDSQLDLTASSETTSIVTGSLGQQAYVASHALGSVNLHQWRLDEYQPPSATYDVNDSLGLSTVKSLIMSGDEAFIYALGDDMVVMGVQDGSQCSASGVGQLSDVADIVADGSVTYTLTGMVLDTATGQITNSATAVTNQDTIELYPNDNIATDNDILVPHSNLMLSKDDGLTEVVAGTDLSYTLDAFSTGPSAVYPLLEDALPIFTGNNPGMLSGSINWACEAPDPIGFNIEYDATQYTVLNQASTMIMNQAGTRVLVAGDSPARISLLEKNAAGELNYLDSVVEGDVFAELTLTGLTDVSAMILDRNEMFIYALDNSSDAIYIFSLIDDVISYVGLISADDDNVVGLNAPVNMIVSPDNKAIYVAAKGSQAVTVFSRNEETGELTFVERVKDGFGTIVPESNVIIGISDLAMTPDGRYLYTAADFSDAIAIFSRNLNNQVLTFEQVIRTGDLTPGGTVPDMDGMNQLLISPNADYLYALAPDAQRLLIFSQDTQSGELEFVDDIDSTDLNMGTVVMPSDMALSPNSGYFLMSDSTSSAVNLYERDENTGLLSWVDTYYATDDPGILMSEFDSMITDGVYVYGLSAGNNALTGLRLVAEAECLTPSGVNDLVQVDLYMKPGSSSQTVINARVHPSARGELINQAMLIMPAGSVEDDPVDNTAEDRTQITIETDVSVSKSAPSDVIAGEMIQYDIVLSNTGPSDALGVQVIDNLDSHLSQVSWTCEVTGRSICQNASGSGDLDETVNVTIDGTVSFTITALVDPYFTGQIDNLVEAVVFEEGFNTDTDLSNNTDSVSTNVTQELDLSVSKQLLTNPIVAGETVSFEVVVMNHGPSASDQVAVTDNLMSGLSDAVWTCTPTGLAVCQLTGQGGLNQVVDIPPGEQVTYILTAMLDPDALGNLENMASIQIPAPVIDIDLTNNSDTVSGLITQLSDIEVLVSDNIDPFDPDSLQRLIYRMQFINHGPSTARNIFSVSDIPALQDDILVVAPDSSCQLDNEQLLCTANEISVGGAIITDVSMLLLADAPGQVQFNSEVSSEYTDPNPVNNIDIETTDLLTGVDVRVQKTDHLDFVEPGVWVEYEITVDNIGSVDAGDVIVSENLPAGLINASWQCQAFGDATCINVDEFGITGGANLPANATVIFTLMAQVDPGLAFTNETEVVNEVSVQRVSGSETSLANNTAEDVDALILYIFKNGFEQVTP
jgi:uncharacterized repeat protein (TIGR01451 family)